MVRFEGPDDNRTDRSLTARGRQGLVQGRVLYGARHAGVFGNVDLQVTRDVVQAGIREWRRQGPHRAFWGLLGVVDEPVNCRFGETTTGVTGEGRLLPLRCFLSLQEGGAETGCEQPSETRS